MRCFGKLFTRRSGNSRTLDGTACPGVECGVRQISEKGFAQGRSLSDKDIELNNSINQDKIDESSLIQLIDQSALRIDHIRNEIQNRGIDRDILEELIGMDIMDAIFLLENLQFKVEFSGRGKVSEAILKDRKIIQLKLL